MNPPSPGEVLADRFRIIRPFLMERGGTLCAAQDLSLGRMVTLRVLDPIVGKKVQERFRREMDVLGRLKHKSAPKLYDVLQIQDGRVLLVFEPLDATRLPERMSLSSAIGIGRSLLATLAEAHQLGIVHRSVTFDCIGLKRVDAARAVPKLLGWGRMTSLGSTSTLSDIDREPTIRGEWAPEVLLTDVVDGRTDIYGVGTVVFRLLTGRPVIDLPEGSKLADVLRLMMRSKRDTADAPAEIRGWLDRALALEPDRRFADADEARAGLEEARDRRMMSVPSGFLQLPESGGSIADRYDVKLELGRGSMGRVLLAHDENLGRDVAIKMLDDVSERSRERFRAEARGLGQIPRHPAIVQVYDYGDTDGVPYLVMEFVPGHDLEDEIQRHPKGMPVARVADLARRLGGGLAALHAVGMVHGDIKPSNVLLRAQGDTLPPDAPPVLVDFGLVRAAVEMDGSVPIDGTPAYLAPERVLLEVKPEFADRVDQYAMAAMMFELLTGLLPFSSDNVVNMLGMHCNDPRPSARAARPELPAAVDEVFLRGMAVDPADRYPDIAAFAAALASALGA